MKQSWNGPEVSVVMSVFNEVEYVRKSIESIINQTFKNWEFIIVIDSPDEILINVINEYSFKDQRIKVIQNAVNIGLTKSLNIGLAASSGKYIARLDADDVSEHNRLLVQYDFLESNPKYSVVGSWATIINIHDQKIGEIRTHNSSKKIKNNLLIKNQFVHSSVMINRTVFEKYGPYNEEFLRSQDYELWLRVRSFVEFYNIPNYLISYRSHEKSITKAYNIEQRLTGLKMMFLFLRSNMNILSIFEKTLIFVFFSKTFFKILKSAYLK